jgi:regulator of sigma D
MNSFESMVATLQHLENWTDHSEKKTVARAEYELFCKEYVFDQLKEIRFGEAFCKRFNIDDQLINTVSNDTAKYHIEILGYIK